MKGHYDWVPAHTRILRSCLHAIEHGFNISCQSCCLSLSEESKISLRIQGKPNVGILDTEKVTYIVKAWRGEGLETSAQEHTQKQMVLQQSYTEPTMVKISHIL